MKTSSSIPLPRPPAGTDEVPGHRLLPRWTPLLEALPRLGPVCVVSRNAHAVAGSGSVYPDVRAGEVSGDLFLEPVLAAWREAWHYRESVGHKVLEGIEFRDAVGAGFHKVLFTEDTDLGHAGTLVRALEQAPLTGEELECAAKTNHLDGVCCPDCRAAVEAESARTLQPARELVLRAIANRTPVRFVLHHPALVTVIRFTPVSWCPQGLWTAIAGDRAQVHLRAHGLSGVVVSRARFPDVGPCQVAKLRTSAGTTVARLILEDSDRDVGDHPAACSQTRTHLARP